MSTTKVMQTNSSGSIAFSDIFPELLNDYCFPRKNLVDRLSHDANFLMVISPGFFISSSGSYSAVNVRSISSSGEVNFAWGEKNHTLGTNDKHALNMHFGVWKGNDIDQMLKMVHHTRSKI
jgi:hypothetical protein